MPTVRIASSGAPALYWLWLLKGPRCRRRSSGAATTSLAHEYQMSVPLFATAPEPPSPGPSASPSFRPSGSSCHVTVQRLPAPRLESCFASRSPKVSCSGGFVVPRSQVVPPSWEIAAHTAR